MASLAARSSSASSKRSAIGGHNTHKARSFTTGRGAKTAALRSHRTGVPHPGRRLGRKSR